MVLWIAYDGHVDSQALGYRALRDCFRRVVRPFRVHIRPELLEQGLDVRFWKQNDVIHVLDRRDQLGAGLLIENRSPGSFEAADAAVGIYTHHQKISFFLCTFEVPNMTDVQSIKTSVRKNDATSVALGFLEQRFELASLHDFGVGLPHTLSDGPQSRLPDRVLQFLTRRLLFLASSPRGRRQCWRCERPRGATHRWPAQACTPPGPCRPLPSHQRLDRCRAPEEAPSLARAQTPPCRLVLA